MRTLTVTVQEMIIMQERGGADRATGSFGARSCLLCVCFSVFECAFEHVLVSLKMGEPHFSQ